MLNAGEKEELIRLANSSSMKEDMRYLSDHRHNPVMIAGQVSMDRLLDFLNDFNEFINHEPKPFKPMIEKEMKL